MIELLNSQLIQICWLRYSMIQSVHKMRLKIRSEPLRNTHLTLLSVCMHTGSFKLLLELEKFILQLVVFSYEILIVK